MSKIKMVICIGSSCFVRGNAENVQIAEDFLQQHDLSEDAEILLCGGLCTGNCADGPVVIVNDEVYTHVESGVMQDILNKYFADKVKKDV